MKIVLASNNRGKLAELQILFAPLQVDIVAQGALMSGEAPEPHCTFIENALSKARFAAEHTGLPAIADDAGLCVEAFDGKPGVDTAHYSQQFGYPKGDTYNVQALLENMAHVDNRRATMVSSLVGLRHAKDPEPLIAVGKVRVEIASACRGTNGFGFDPVLLIPELNRTFAELPEELKNQYSHRGQSARQMLTLVRQFWLHQAAD